MASPSTRGMCYVTRYPNVIHTTQVNYDLLDKHGKATKLKKPPTKEQLAAIANILGQNPNQLSAHVRSTKKRRQQPGDENEDEDNNGHSEDDVDNAAQQQRRRRNRAGQVSTSRTTGFCDPKPWQMQKLSPPSLRLNREGKGHFLDWAIRNTAYPTPRTHSKQTQRHFEKAAKNQPISFEKCMPNNPQTVTTVNVPPGHMLENFHDRERLVSTNH